MKTKLVPSELSKNILQFTGNINTNNELIQKLIKKNEKEYRKAAKLGTPKHLSTTMETYRIAETNLP